MPEPTRGPARTADSMFDPRVIDPDEQLIGHSGMDDADIAQTVRVLVSLRTWREAEQRLGVESRTRMRLNETDMRALRFLVVAKNQGTVVTPGALAEHLDISTASVTKLLDRLGRAGHIERAPHPSDRRALAITIADRTHEEVRESVGRAHARRFEIAARLSPAEREVVIRFLDDLGGTGDGPGLREGPATDDDATDHRIR